MDNNVLQTIYNAEQILKKWYLETVPKDTKNLILILFPPTMEITGGTISILNIAKITRTLMEKEGYFVQMGHYPNYNFLFKYRRCENDENILNFDDVVDNFPDVENLIMHVPECHATVFLKNLNEKHANYLKKIKNLQINIMNQNITLMPEPSELEYLKEFTTNITQTTAHHKYTNQKVCDKWGYPLYFFHAMLDTKYLNLPYEEKQNIICYSKDDHPYKAAILNKLNQNCSEFQLVEINKLSFEQYKDLISKAKYSITFGEGFDGYFVEPIFSGSVAFAVYNEKFFPSQEYKNYKNVYSSYDEMLQIICDDIKFYESNIEEYKKLNSEINTEFNKKFSMQAFIENIEKFYKKEPTFVSKLKAPVKAN